MQNLSSFKNKSQESISNLIERGKQQPEEVKTWGITAAAGLGGALAVAAAAKGVLAIVGTLAYPPVALTIGALGGGALGWSWTQQQADATGTKPGVGDNFAPAVAGMAEGTVTVADVTVADVTVADVPITDAPASDPTVAESDASDA